MGDIYLQRLSIEVRFAISETITRRRCAVVDGLSSHTSSCRRASSIDRSQQGSNSSHGGGGMDGKRTQFEKGSRNVHRVASQGEVKKSPRKRLQDSHDAVDGFAAACDMK